MNGFALLLAHLVGDYIVQWDWLAANKTVPGFRGLLACTVHCWLYTVAVWAFSWWWMPWWGPALCFAAHWPIDRFRLARVWMIRVSGQAAFATGPLAPWSVIVIDNVFHLLTLYGIALLAGVPT